MKISMYGNEPALPDVNSIDSNSVCNCILIGPGAGVNLIRGEHNNLIGPGAGKDLVDESNITIFAANGVEYLRLQPGHPTHSLVIHKRAECDECDELKAIYCALEDWIAAAREFEKNSKNDRDRIKTSGCPTVPGCEAMNCSTCEYVMERNNED